MSLGEQITAKLNSIESFNENSANYLFPVKILGWIVLFIALIITNIIAIIQWPVVVIVRKFNQSSPAVGEPINVRSAQELQALIAQHEQVLVDFWAQWCGPCLLMNNTLNELAHRHADDLLVVKVDVSLNSSLSQLYGVRGLPTVIVFNNGEEAARKSGALTMQQLQGLIK
ncbi:thioredoxin family protein [Thalassotalea sp. G2M2-11]|uniref:thioredoxin family protein n=1 Tax=Thalassotalea sp. G2M2-11 TaxID=2787627 RepID=UPI0019D214AF|nr:thioredoxin family protein [Thalassotalea sp. G2M2-11]